MYCVKPVGRASPVAFPARLRSRGVKRVNASSDASLSAELSDLDDPAHIGCAHKATTKVSDRSHTLDEYMRRVIALVRCSKGHSIVELEISLGPSLFGPALTTSTLATSPMVLRRLPVEQYNLLDPKLIQHIGENKFILSVPRFELFNIWCVLICPLTLGSLL